MTTGRDGPVRVHDYAALRMLRFRLMSIETPKDEGSEVISLCSVVSSPHYQVVREGYTSRMRTLSEQVLLDPDFYHRVE